MASFSSQNPAENYAGDCAAQRVHRWPGQGMKFSNDTNLLIVVKMSKCTKCSKKVRRLTEYVMVFSVSDKMADENQCW